jgi:hypothetical protein
MVDKSQIDAALSAHAQWRNRLNEAIEKGTSEFQVDTVKVDNACQFGKWLYGLPPSDQNSEEAKKIKELHAAFHKVAAETLSMALSGKKEEANKSMQLGGNYNRASGKLVLALTDWKNKQA